MHRILTFALGLHWTVHFALLAVWATGVSAFPSVYDWFGADARGFLIEGGMATGAALGFGLAAVVFFWLTITVGLDRRLSDGATDDVARLAFAVAIGMLTLVLVIGATRSESGLLTAVSLQLAALLASYVAIAAEARSAVERAEVERADAESASFMALDAAHNSMLSRLSGRLAEDGRF